MINNLKLPKFVWNFFLVNDARIFIFLMTNKKFDTNHLFFGIPLSLSADHLMCFLYRQNSKGATKRNVFITKTVHSSKDLTLEFN